MTQPPDNSSSLQILEGVDAFRDALIAATSSTRRELDLFSPALEPLVYDQTAFAEALSALARRHRQARIRLLVSDTKPLVERGHSLVRLSQRLPSKILLRRLNGDIESNAAAFLLSDRDQLVYQNDPDTYRGFRDRKAGAEVNNLREIFNRAWEQAVEDPQLRQLSL